MENVSKVIDKVTDDITLSKGCSFEFQDGENTILTWGSVKSGREKVYLNGELIIERNNLFSRKSYFVVQSGEDEYTIELNVANFWTGELHCILIKNGTHVRTLKKRLKDIKVLPNGKVRNSIGWVGTIISWIVGGWIGWYTMPFLINFLG